MLRDGGEEPYRAEQGVERAEAPGERKPKIVGRAWRAEEPEGKADPVAGREQR